MNDFLKNIQSIATESLGIDMPSVDPYAGMETGEEMHTLDQLDLHQISLESTGTAIIAETIGMQEMALEHAGLDITRIKDFNGPLGLEAIGNMIKRGYYEVKIQAKKIIQKIWKIIMAVVDYFRGSDARLKSYGKLFKKYSERLSKTYPKDKTATANITVRDWTNDQTVNTLKEFKGIANVDMWKGINGAVKAVDPKDIIASMTTLIADVAKGFGKEVDLAKLSAGISKLTTTVNLNELEDAEKQVNEFMADKKFQEMAKEKIAELKSVESVEMTVEAAISKFVTLGKALEAECDKDIKFKKELNSLKKNWEKKFESWSFAEGTDEDVKAKWNVILRVMNKVPSMITILKMALTSCYGAIASNLQGVLADMSKVIAKAQAMV